MGKAYVEFFGTVPAGLDGAFAVLVGFTGALGERGTVE